MRVIIEGADLVGKTTITEYLMEKYNLSRVHTTSRDPNTYDFYKHTLDKQDVVFDRHFIGEMIYPSIFNREGNLDEKKFKQLLNKANELHYRIFVITVDDELLKQRLKIRKEPKEVEKRIFEINRKFKEIANKYNIKILDMTNMTIKEIKERIDYEIFNYG